MFVAVIGDRKGIKYIGLFLRSSSDWLICLGRTYSQSCALLQHRQRSA